MLVSKESILIKEGFGDQMPPRNLTTPQFRRSAVSEHPVPYLTLAREYRREGIPERIPKLDLNHVQQQLKCKGKCTKHVDPKLTLAHQQEKGKGKKKMQSHDT